MNACNEILRDLVSGKSAELSPGLIKNLNRQVLAQLPLEKHVVPGETRITSVGVGRHRGAPAEDCEYLLEWMCSFVNTERQGNPQLDRLPLSVLLSVTAHLYSARIHPFGDGNGRTARLVEFLLLLDGGTPAPATHLLSNHYNLTPTEYYRQLNQASSPGGDLIPSLLYALQGFVDGLKRQLAEVRRYQHLVIWRDYVNRRLHAQGRAGSAEVRARQREVLMALSERDQPVPIFEVTRLTPAS
ncbi:MAG: Fic family protein [Spirochaetales bacterium]|nr:Fic family protein [Spirochaetales bacterium]